MKEPELKMVRMPAMPVHDALLQQMPQIVGHLDLEGVAYVKLTRTGAKTCFASDATADVLPNRGHDLLKGRSAMERFAK